MAFKDCFYLQFLKDETPGIDFSEIDFNWQPDEIKPNMYYGYEKADGSEPNWVKIGFSDGEIHHIDVVIGQKIYFKGTMPLSAIWRDGQSSGAHHEFKWFGLSEKKSNTILKVGGCINSMFFDGDGTRDLELPGPIGIYYPNFWGLCRGFPGHVILYDMILPTNTLNTYGLFQYFFADCNEIMEIPRNWFPKHKLGMEEYCGLFQNVTVRGPVYLPFTSEDLSHRCIAALFYQGKVKEIHVAFNSWVQNSTWNWVTDIKALSDDFGKFYCPGNLPEIYDRNHIPQNWKINPPGDPTSAGFAAAHKLGGRKI